MEHCVFFTSGAVYCVTCWHCIS